MALGIVLCFVYLLYVFQWSNFNEESVDKMLLFGIGATGFGVFMAMVFQALYDYIESPSQGFSLGGSMTFQGGLIGGVSSFLIVWNLYVFVIAPRTKIKALQNNMNASLSDALPMVPLGITIAHAFGRLGCTFAGCCHGAQTDKWYGVWMYTSEWGYAKVVPTQAYECLFLVILTVIMALLYFKWKFKYNFTVYAIGYGVWRFLIEYVRDDYRGSFIGSITPSQFWSIIMVLFGIGYFFVAKYFLSRFEKHPQNQPPVREKKVKAKAKTAADGSSDVTEGPLMDGSAVGANDTATGTAGIEDLESKLEKMTVEEAEEIADSLTLDEIVGDDSDGDSSDSEKKN